MMDEFTSSNPNARPFGQKRPVNWRLFYFILFLSPAVGSAIVAFSMIASRGITSWAGLGESVFAAAMFALILYPVGLPIALLCAAIIAMALKACRVIDLRAIVVLAGIVPFLFGLVGLHTFFAGQMLSLNLGNENSFLGGFLLALAGIATALIVRALALRFGITTRSELFGLIP